MDDINVRFSGQLFRQMVGIPMGTNCAPLLANLFLYSYENELIDKGKSLLESSISHNDNNKRCEEFHIYTKEPTISGLTTESISVASYLYLLFTRDENNNITTTVYDKCDTFDFHTVNFSHTSSNILSAPAYGVHVSQLICHAHCC